MAVRDSKNAFDEIMIDKKKMEELVEQTYTVPRPALVKCLFASYLVITPYKESFDLIVGSQNEVIEMVKVLKTVFTTKNAEGKTDGLVHSIKQYLNGSIQDSPRNLKLIRTIMQSSDMQKIKPQVIHDYLPKFWNFVTSYLSKHVISEEQKVVDTPEEDIKKKLATAIKTTMHTAKKTTTGEKKTTVVTKTTIEKKEEVKGTEKRVSTAGGVSITNRYQST